MNNLTGQASPSDEANPLIVPQNHTSTVDHAIALDAERQGVSFARLVFAQRNDPEMICIEENALAQWFATVFILGVEWALEHSHPPVVVGGKE